MEQSAFISTWHNYTLYLSYFFFALGIVIFLVYQIGLGSTKGYAKKYEYVSARESKYMWYALLAIVIGAAFLLNSYVQLLFDSPGSYEFIIGIFISLILAVAIGYAAYAYFKFYYPSVIEDKLNTLRFKPRISPETGKKMKLLTEEEEDVHLTEEMIAHEASFSYEYDVWIDEETGHKFIERYDMHYHAEICPVCSFRTLRDEKEEIVASPTVSEPGVLKKYYLCSYCDHEEIRETKIAPLSKGSDMKILP